MTLYSIIHEVCGPLCRHQKTKKKAPRAIPCAGGVGKAILRIEINQSV